MSNTRLYRSESDRILGGICGGLAEIYDLDPTLVRLLTVLVVLGTGVGPLLYLIAWLIMPTESEVKSPSEEVEIDDSENDEEEESEKSVEDDESDDSNEKGEQ